MILEKELISLKDFMNDDYKKIFVENKSIQDHFCDICQRYIDYGFSILEEKPLEALEIYMLLNEFHDFLGVMPDEILSLSENIVVNISRIDLKRSIELIDLIEIECFKTNALIRIAEITEDIELINIIANKISLYGDSEDIVNFHKQYKDSLKISLIDMLTNEKNER